MGLTRRLLVGAAALLLLAGTACSGSGDGDGDRDADDPPSSSSEPATTTEALGGSRYLAYSGYDGDAHQVVVEDLVEGTVDVVATPDEPVDSLDVDARGAVAWSRRSADERSAVQVVGGGGATPVEVDAPDVGCPRWRADGSLLVTVVDEDGTTDLALVDHATGAVTRRLGAALGDGVCATPAGPDHVVFPRPEDEEAYGPAGAEIVRLAVATGEEDVVGHIDPFCWANDIAASPDGTRLAAGVYCGPEVTPDGYALHVGTMADDLAPLVAENEADTPQDTAVQYWSPTWSADGSQIAYHRSDPAGEERSPHLWAVDGDGGAPRSLGPDRAALPALSAG